jgi:peptide/nickel transport system substrate-binding protein
MGERPTPTPRGRLLRALATLAAFMLLAGAAAQTIVAADSNFERSPDPNNTFSLTDLYINRHIYDPLVEIREGGEIGPMLAHSWQLSDDGLTWTFELRDDVSFHHGTPFTAADVKFTFDRIVDGGMAQAFLFRDLAEVEVVDDTTVTFRTSRPAGAFLTSVAMVSIVPADAVEELGEGFYDVRYGTGPFRFVEHRPNEHWILERNDDYWREGLPRAERVQVRMIFEEATAQAGIQAGEIDILTAVSPDLALVLQGSPDVDVVYVPGFETTYLQVNVGREPFDDPRVVEAFNYAIDRSEITEGLWLGEAQPAAAYVPPGMLGHHEGLEVFPYDPERSRALLDEAGYPDGVTVEMVGPTAVWPQSQQVQEAIQAQAAEAGFDIRLNMLETAAYVQNRNEGQYDVVYISSIAVTQEGMRFLTERLLDDVHASGYQDDEFERLMGELLTATEAAEQQALFEAVQEYLYGAPPHVYLYHPPAIYAVRSDVVGFTPRPDRSLYLWETTKE